jgi:hypothetical protein
MKLIDGKQLSPVQDPVRAKLAIVVPVLKATLSSLARDRITRLGGLEKVTLHDLAREFREGNGDAGICFEYAVHEAIAAEHSLIHPLISEVLEDLCKIHGGAQSILFGPEKEGVIPILESVTNALTDDSVVYVGNKGRPPKLRRYIPKIIRAYRRNEEQNRLPRSITGLWKADLFVGNRGHDAWVGTTIKINADHLVGAKGLRIGIYPKRNKADGPCRDAALNLIRLPLPYDGQFMEVFYKAFFLVRSFLRSDALVPKPVDLPDAEDRLITQQLQDRRDFPLLEVIGSVAAMAQPSLLGESEVEDRPINAALSEAGGLQTNLPLPEQSDAVSVSPIPQAPNGA